MIALRNSANGPRRPPLPLNGRIGEIGRDLEKGHKVGRGNGQIQLPSDGKLKAEQLAEAGISTSTAHLYEELTGGREEQAQTTALSSASFWQNLTPEPIAIR
jgi:hypothetical protein